MSDYLAEILFNKPFLLVYALVLAVSLIRYERYYDTPLRYFPILLMFNLLTEILGMRIIDGRDGRVIFTNFYSNLNWLAYNIHTLAFFLYMFYIYLAYLENPKLRKALFMGVSIYVITSIGNIFIQDFLTESQLWSYVVGVLLVIFFTASYLWQEYQKKEVPGKRLHNLLIWISLGNLVFFVGYAPLKLYRSFWASDLWADNYWIRNAHLVLIYLLHFCLLAGFLLMWRMKRPKRNIRQIFQGKENKKPG